MKRGQGKRKGFTPTAAQEQRRLDVLRTFNRPFPALRHRIYCGAIWAGCLIPSGVESYYQEELTKIVMRSHERRAAGTAGILQTDYSGKYNNVAEEELSKLDLEEMDV